MQDNIKNKVVVILFGLIIYGFFFLNLVAPDKKSSVSERRKLEQFPKVTLKAIISGDFFKKFDSYSMDQFYQREKFRKLKIKTDMVVLGNYNNMQIDNDYIYEVNDIYPHDNREVSVERIEELAGKKNKIGRRLIQKLKDEELIELALKLNITEEEDSNLEEAIKNNIPTEYNIG